MQSSESHETIHGGYRLSKPNQPDAAHFVRVQLTRKSKELGADFELLLTRYGLERLLYRLSQSKYVNQFILKGASMFLVWKGQNFRVTKDVDLLGFGDPSIERLHTVFTEVISDPYEDDGVQFQINSLKVEPIKEWQEYNGVRITMIGMLGKARIPIQIDIGFGDAVVPKAEFIDFPSILDFPQAHIRGYSHYTLAAEKIEAMVKLGIANSRMKDFYDLCLLSRMFEFEQIQFSEAIKSTFERRKTSFPTKPPIALTEEFWSDLSKQSQWHGFVKKSKPLETVGSLQDAISEIAQFILPVLNLVSEQESKHWIPSKGWTL